MRSEPDIYVLYSVQVLASFQAFVVSFRIIQPPFGAWNVPFTFTNTFSSTAYQESLWSYASCLVAWVNLFLQRERERLESPTIEKTFGDMERVKDFSKLSIDLKQNENCATMATKLATHGSGNWSVIDLKRRYTQHVNSQHVITK